MITVLKRPQLSTKIEEFEKNSSDKNLKKGIKDCIIRYYMCANALFDESNSQPIQNFLRNIINKKDGDDNTPLHYAVKYWPQNIVQKLLRLGADLSVKNKNQKIPLKKVPKEYFSEPSLKGFFEEGSEKYSFGHA